MNPYRALPCRKKAPKASTWRKIRAFFWSKPAANLPNWIRGEGTPLFYGWRMGLRKRLLARTYRKAGGSYVSIQAELDGARFFETAQRKALQSVADTAIRALHATYPSDTEKK